MPRIKGFGFGLRVSGFGFRGLWDWVEGLGFTLLGLGPYRSNLGFEAKFYTA